MLYVLFQGGSESRSVTGPTSNSYFTDHAAPTVSTFNIKKYFLFLSNSQRILLDQSKPT